MAAKNEIKLDSLYAFKLGMSTVFNEAGEAVNVTLLKYEPLVVSEVKTKEKHGYEAVQVAFGPKKAGRASTAEVKRLKGAGFENGAYFCREIRQSVPEGAAVGAHVGIDSLKTGDNVKVTAKSKGKGFQGVVRRYGFAGGPAAHGSKFHRQPGSVGCREFPGRVMPGRRLPGHKGNKTATTMNLSIVDVLPEDNILIVAGAVPGGRNNLVKLTKSRM